jgi:DNA polymerase-3 subunit gamma/tau
MTLLRMLSFTPNDTGNAGIKTPGMTHNNTSATTALKQQSVESVASHAPFKQEASAPVLQPSISNATSPAPVQAKTVQAAVPEPVSLAAQLPAEEATAKVTGDFNGDWRRLVDELKLGLAKALAQQCELVSYDEHSISLTVPENQKHLLLPNYQEKLSSAIAQYYGKKVRLQFSIGGTGNTPAKQILQEKAHAQANAVTAIEEDGFVQALINDFGAQIIPNSIKPIQ